MCSSLFQAAKIVFCGDQPFSHSIKADLPWAPDGWDFEDFVLTSYWTDGMSILKKQVKTEPSAVNSCRTRDLRQKAEL
ncbi:hypothetical protein GJAV_G00173000 [Gymnothorax javanicus]|nr:hypothetical protein GJAV_G00173000 [Gymnothorax javanicus]